MSVDYVASMYAVFVAGGGILGYVRAGSIISLSMGLIFGLILSYGAYQTSQNPSNNGVIMGGAAILTGIMGTRYYHSGQLMPAGLVAIVSFLVLLRYYSRSYRLES